MKKSTRHLEILEILQREQKVNVNELAKYFQTSEMTIRRDLNSLAQQYNLTRTYGGAVLGDRKQVVRIVSFDEDRIPRRQEKERIAARAATLIRNGQRIFIDAGSTTRILMHYLPEDLKAVVVCNHLGVAQEALNFTNLSVVMLGGDVLRLSNCSSGPVAEEQISKYTLDAAFIGAAAIGEDGNLFDGYSPEARFKSKIFDVANKIYVLADSTKIGTYDLNQFGHLSHIDGLITDSGINREGQNLMKRYQVNVMIT